MRRFIATGFSCIRSNAAVLKNAILLAMGSASAAALGFAYWWLAAMTFPPAAVGAQAALISVMAFIGLLGEAGFGTMLIGEVRGEGEKASPLIAAASLAGMAAALALAVPTAGALCYFDWMTPTAAALFAVGCALTGLALVLDQAFVGLMCSTLQFSRNFIFSSLKLVLLVAAAAVTQSQAAIMLTWVVALAVSCAVISGYTWAKGVLRLTTPDFRSLAEQAPAVIDHHLLNLAATAPTLIMPFVVSVCLGPAVNAAFYAGWTILSLCFLVPASLTTVLFSVGAVDPAALPARLWFSLLLSTGFGIAGAGVMGFFPDGILRLFNPAYPALAASAVQLFGLGLLGTLVKQHYILLARIRRSMRTASLWLAIGAGLELGLAALGGAVGDVRWLTTGWVVAMAVEAGFLARPVLRYARPESAESLA